jgi:hypothetical protein
MKSKHILSATLAAFLVLAQIPAHATSEHDYAKGEYAIIRDGLSPNKQMSLASRGEGEGGQSNFHVWLMAEPRHRKLVALDEIGSDNNLDSAPDAYHAFWSENSRFVAVAFRSSRHEIQLNLYRIGDRRAHLIKGPNLFHAVTGREVADGDDLRQRIFAIDWRGSNRFRLREYRTFVAADDSLARMFGAYGRVTDKLDDGKVVVEFSAEAECEALSRDTYRIVARRPGKPGVLDVW